MNLTAKAGISKVLELLRWKLATPGTKEFRQIYPICMTGKDFAGRARKALHRWRLPAGLDSH